MLFETERALRVDPADFETAATDFGDSATDATASITALNELFATYRGVQQGPDVDVIEASVSKLVSGFVSAISGYESLSAAFATAHRTTSNLETDSDALWDEVLLVTEVLTPKQETGFQQRFDTIRDAEETAMAALASVVEQTPTGTDIELDGSAVGELIGRLIDKVSDADTDLAVAQVLLSDYEEDSDFDISVAEMSERKQRHTELLKLDTDPELATALALTGDLAFIDAVIDAHIPAIRGVGEGRSIEQVIDELGSAMLDGKAPSEAGLPDGLFPAEYLELKELEAELDGPLRKELDEASGWVWLPEPLDPGDDGSARSAAQEKIDINEARQAELREQLGIGGSPGMESDAKLNIGETSAALINHTDMGGFWAERFATELKEQGVESGVPESDIKASEVGLDQMSPHIANDERTATAFFNELGADGSANIVQTYEDGMRQTFVELGDGLGLVAESGDLEFDGAEYIQGGHKRSVHQSHANPIQLLVISDKIPDEFLVEATAESFRQSERVGAGGDMMGDNGPYNDVPDGVVFEPEDGTRLPIGTFEGQTTSGRYGSDEDEASLVLFNLIGERGPDLTFGFMEELGAENAGAILRRPEGWLGNPPTGWDTIDADGVPVNRTSEILFEATLPAAGSSTERTDDAAVWLIENAGNPSDGNELALNKGAADAVEKVFIHRPTIMVQGEDAAFRLDLANQSRGVIDSEFNESTIDNALEAVFLGDEGDELVALKHTLIPIAVAEGIAIGDGDPSALADTTWLGEIDGRIDGACRGLISLKPMT